MNSIGELVEQLKEGKITKDEMLELIHLASISKSTDSLGRREGKEEEDQGITFDSGSFEGGDNRTLEEPTFSFSTADGFFERQMQWEAKKLMNQELLRDKKVKFERQECTFQPKTHYSPSRFTQETLNRLSQHKDTSKYAQSKKENDYKNLQKELEACTFEPMINRTSAGAESRYLSQSPPSKPRSSEEHRFAPRVKGPLKHMTSAREYIKQNPFERLSKHKVAFEPEVPTSLSKSPVPECSGVSFSSKSFFERQALFELNKKDKIEAMDLYFDHKPVINERSKRLVKKTFSQRNQEMIEKKQSPKKDPNVFPFRPKITKMAKMKKYSSFRSIAPEKPQVFISEAASPEPIYEQMQARNSYSGIKSKLQILQDPEEFIERLKAEQRAKEIEIMMSREDKMRKELEECTHQPAVIDAPDYVKQIARNMAMLKSELSTQKSPERVGWR